jgi:hypothetical protein
MPMPDARLRVLLYELTLDTFQSRFAWSDAEITGIST